ncbi:hypothetical protein AZE42_14167 [Rhizopogon vesiculosus]|uniref:Uncharacterized protein n=1 Tax=Rhizopogon vesiculosus TaxID=180088 RepID=A0A1J8QIU2_9AGAM|nr:hypothetical protein AZE42_14167 [Rhizopogon vesiculosus]
MMERSLRPTLTRSPSALVDVSAQVRANYRSRRFTVQFFDIASLYRYSPR